MLTSFLATFRNLLQIRNKQKLLELFVDIKYQIDIMRLFTEVKYQILNRENDEIRRLLSFSG